MYDPDFEKQMEESRRQQELQQKIFAIQSEYTTKLNTYIDGLFDSIKSKCGGRSPFDTHYDDKTIIENIEEYIRIFNSSYDTILQEIKNKEYGKASSYGNMLETGINLIYNTTMKRPAAFTIEYVLPILTYLKVSKK
jgi:hypothetical protein